LERVWPQLTPAAFLQDLLGSRQRITAAAGDDFTAGDIERLYRPSAEKLASETWSDTDVALLDEANFLINGRGAAHAHVIVDEAQDLSPMQLRSVRRRSARGSCTLVGDLAQSTGPWARTSWDDVVEALLQDYEPQREELSYGYRVPKQVTDLADCLLPLIAPDLQPPTVIRSGPQDPVVTRLGAEDVIDGAIDAARNYAADGHFVGVICSDEMHDAIAARMKERQVMFSDAARGHLGNAINLMSASQSKGLEFDATVVVEPAAIAGTDHSGLRQLYIALTRTTKFLTIVHSADFPILGMGEGEPKPPVEDAEEPESTVAVETPVGDNTELDDNATHASAPASPMGIRARTIRATAGMLADEVRGTLGPDAFEELVTALAEELGVNLEVWDRPELF
jgi:DNA helicase IV